MAAGTSISNTAYGIINDAAVDAGLIQEGQRLDSEQLANYMRRLNDIVNLWQTYGLKLFFQYEGALAMTAGQSVYSFGPAGSGIEMTKPARILQGFMQRAPELTRRPLTMISVEEWERLNQVVNNDGVVNSFMVRKFPYYLEVSLWPTPNEDEAGNNTAIFLFQLAPKGPVILSDNTSFPQEWRIALRWALAEDISTGQPQSIIDRCARNAETYRTQLENWDVEDAPTMFQLDMRMGQGYGRFK